MTVNSTMVRWLVGEKVPIGGSDQDTFFTDADIDVLVASTDSESGAALKGWLVKTAEYARLIDIDESGSVRHLSQKYKQAFEQVKFWRDQLAAEVSLANAHVGRVAGGRTANIWGANSGELVMIANKLVNGTLNIMYRDDPFWNTGSLSNAPMVVDL